jgi:hypothetical protein
MTARESRLGVAGRKPYSFSGTTKAFLGMHVICLLLIIAEYVLVLSADRPGVIRGSAVVASIYVLLAESVAVFVVMIVALVTNASESPSPDARLEKMRRNASLTLTSLVIFVATIVGIAVITSGKILVLPGGGSVILFFVLLADIRSWTRAHEYAMKRQQKKADREGKTPDPDDNKSESPGSVTS